MNCKRCGGEDHVKDGIVGGKQQYQCQQCKRTSIFKCFLIRRNNTDLDFLIGINEL